MVILEKVAALGEDVARGTRFFLRDTQYQYVDVVELVTGAVELRYTRGGSVPAYVWAYGSNYAAAVAGYDHRVRKFGFLTWREEIR